MAGMAQIMADQDRNLTGAEGALRRLSQVGVVVARYAKRHTVKARLPNCGGFISGEVHVGTVRAGHDRESDLPDIGEQGLVIFPGGDLREGFWICSLFSKKTTPPTDNGNVWRREFYGGGAIEANRHEKTITIEAGEGWTVYLGGPGDEARKVARVGDLVHVTSGSSAGFHPIYEGSDLVRCK